MTILYTTLGMTIALIGFGMALALYRAIVGPDGASRTIISDLIFFSVLSIIALIGILTHASVVFDIVLIGALLAPITTVALSRVVNRGHR